MRATLIAVAALAAPGLELSPPDASTFVTERHEVVATGAPPGVEVRFDVLRHGARLDGATVAAGADGRAAFGYAWDGPGVDTIRACLPGGQCATAINDMRPQPSLEPGFGWLYDGRPPDDWEQEGAGAVAYQGGALVTTGGPGVLRHRTWEPPHQALHLAYKLEDAGDVSGVLLGGHEVRIHDGAATPTGTVGGDLADRRASAPPGHWNHLVVRAEGAYLTVAVNGRVVNRVRGGGPWGGRAGLRNHDAGSRVRFRYVRAAALAAADPADVTPPVTTAAVAGDRLTLSAVEAEWTTLSLDGGPWRTYDGPLTVAAGAHTLRFRSFDASGNAEPVRELRFTVAPPAATPRPPAAPGPSGDPPRAPARFRVLGARFTRAGVRVRVRCTRPMRGSARVTVTRSAARRLGLRGRTTLARRTLACTTERSLRLTPPRAVRRALRRPLRATLRLRLAAPGEPGQTAARRVMLRAR